MKRHAVLALAGILLAVTLWFLETNINQGTVQTIADKPAATLVRSLLTKPAPGFVPLSARSERSVSGSKSSPGARPSRKRPWETGFLDTLRDAVTGGAIRFELVAGEFASGQIRYVQITNGQVVSVSGELTEPVRGRFFFQKQTSPGVAGSFVGFVTLPAREMAYRIEPTGVDGAPELIERPLRQVMCLRLPPPPASLTNQNASAPPRPADDIPPIQIPPYQNGIIPLESLHGAAAVVYLDFQGGYTPTWGGITYTRPAVSNPQIQDVWERVSEDFLPFNINVTTDLAAYQSAQQSSRQRVIITPTTTAAAEAGGVALIGSFDWTGDTPCWVFVLSGKGCAEACSHEIGHTLGLTHDGQEYGGQLFEYYSGHGTGDTSWAPIMGLPYFANVTQWSKGEYLYADNLQDQLAIIATQNNRVGYRNDDTGDSLATARYLELYDDYTASAEGIIGRAGDADAFRFTTGGGLVSLRADPTSTNPNLAIQVSLYDQEDTLLATSNPQDTLWAKLSAQLPAGTYTFRVSGAGRNNPLTNGFSTYGSLGYYSVTGAVANASLPDRFKIPEHSTNGTTLGLVHVSDTNQFWQFIITSGNDGNTFSIDTNGELKVADNTLLDYDYLARRAFFPIEFDLSVDIINQAEPSLNETNHRVVVTVTYVPTPPSIRKQPTDLSVPAGSTPSLLVSAIGDMPLTYQWFFDGEAIAGVETPVLQLIDAQSSNAGAYFVIVSNALGAVTSAVAHVSILPSAPVILSQPQVQGTALGFPASFSVVAAGTEPLSYQWQLNDSNVDGATQSTFSLPYVLPEFTGNYRVVASNEVGTVTSDVAQLLIEPVAAWGWNGDGQTDLYADLSNAVQIAAGPNYNLALRREGTVFSWGATNAAHVPLDLTNAVAVAAGGSHALALRADGTVQAWGDNGAGQVGLPAGLNKVVAIAAGASHSLALKANGNVFAWGSGTNGQETVPALLSNVVAIAAGSNHSLAVTGDGKVWAWGENSSGQTQVPTNLANVVSVAAGALHSLALLADGTVVAWGDNRLGQAAVPSGLKDIIAVAAGAYHSLALNRVGFVFAWGAGLTNGLSYPQFGQSIIPQAIRNGNVTAIAGGEAHSLVFDGQTPPFITLPPVSRRAFTGHPVTFRVAATGGRPLEYQWQFNGIDLVGAVSPILTIPHALTNDAGDYRVVIGNGLGSMTSAVATLTLDQAAPTITAQPQGQQPMLNGQTTLQVTAYGSEPLFYQWRLDGSDIPGANSSTLSLTNLVLTQSGYYSVVVSNSIGVSSSAKAKVSVMQVIAWGSGLNNFGQYAVPPGMSDVQLVTGGSYHSLALESIGRVVAWGAGTNSSRDGYSGPYSYGQSIVPVGLADAIGIAAGLNHSLALRRDGSVLAWGLASAQTAVPDSLSDAVAIGAGYYHSMALQRNGRVMVWGSQFSVTNLPPGVINVVALSSRAVQSVVVKGDSHVIRWGSSTSVPPGLSEVVDVAAGVNHAVALKSDGTVAPLEAGNPSPTGLSNVVQICAGSGFTLALQSDGSVAVWGLNATSYGVARLPSGLRNVRAIGCGDYHCLAALGDGSVSICVQPISHVVAPGDPTFLRVGATGVQPLAYQWRLNDLPLINETNPVLKFSSLQTSNAGSYSVVITNVSGSITSSVASIALASVLEPPSVSLQNALGSPMLTWATGGSAAWFGQTNVALNGSPTAQSGHVLDSQQSWVQTSLLGPGVVTFWWKVSSEQFFDKLNFYHNGILLTGISGEVDWQTTNLTISAGTHLLKWNYEKDVSASSGLDAGWLADVVFLPDYPVIVSQPLGQTSVMGVPITLSASVTGSPPLFFQWFKNGILLPEATNSFFTISNATRRSSGSYQIVASNSIGSASSLFAPVLVRVPQRLSVLSAGPAGGFQLISRDADGGALLSSDLAGFKAQASTNLLDWVDVPSRLLLTNGVLQLADPGATSDAAAFYRVLERSP